MLCLNGKKLTGDELIKVYIASNHEKKYISIDVKFLLDHTLTKKCEFVFILGMITK